MYVKLKNGTTVNCSNPIEQKIFKGGTDAGWICSLSLTSRLNSNEIDELVTADNMSEMTFFNDDGETIVTLSGYSKLTSAVIRHSDINGSVDIQLTKPNLPTAEN
jgi:hypothetical protein